MRLDATSAGLLMIPYGLGTLIAMPVAGRLSDRIDGRVVVWAGTAIALAGFLFLLTTGPRTAPAMFATLSFIIGLGLGAIGSPTVSTLYCVLPGDLPSGSTILFVVNQLGGALGVALMVLFIDSSECTAAVAASSMLALALIATRMRGREGLATPV